MTVRAPYARVKKSGVEWLGEVPEHWELRRGKTLFGCIDERSTAGQEELLTVSSDRGVIPRAAINRNNVQSGVVRGTQTLSAWRLGDQQPVGLEPRLGRFAPPWDCQHRVRCLSCATAIWDVFGTTFMFWCARCPSTGNCGFGRRESGFHGCNSLTSLSLARHFPFLRCPNNEASSVSSTTPTGASVATSAPRKS